jgi:spore germination protein GerM
MTRRSLPPTIIMLATLAIAGCGVPGQSQPTQLDENGVRIVASETTTSLPRGTPTRRVDLCLVADDHLITVPTELPTPLTVRRTLQALVNAPRTKLPAGTRSAINDPRLITANTSKRGVAQIDLSTDLSQIPPADQILALAQVVCTLTSLPGIGQVHFTRAGHPIDIPRADGSLTNKPVARSDYGTLIPIP